MNEERGALAALLQPVRSRLWFATAAQAVQDALAALTANRTLLVIAHRLRTVMAADQILVLDGGRIAESGTHAQLIGGGGRYAAFWQLRRGAEGWRLVPGSDGAAAVRLPSLATVRQQP